MRVELVKHFTVEDVEAEIKRLVTAYGSVEALTQKAAVSKCSHPTLQDELQLWRALASSHAETRSIVAFEGTEKVGNLTPARMELLEIIRKTRPKSVRELALTAKRDYKNVYDDLKALEDAGLVEIVLDGRKSRPVCIADEVRLMIES
jgi:predicted transcriptional regulator